MRRMAGLLLLVVIGVGLLGCGTGSKAGEKPPGSAPGQGSTATQSPATGQGSASSHTSTPIQSPAPNPTPPPPPAQTVTRTGDDLEVALPNITNLVWSPSGRLAVVQTDTRNYLLDTEKPDLNPLPLDSGNIRFWSETELLFTPRGEKNDLTLRDLTTGKDRVLHPSNTGMFHRLQPGDQTITYLVSTGAGPAGIFGKLYWSRLGDSNATLLLEESRLIGRMADGSTIAIGAIGPAGPLWAIQPDGTKHQVTGEQAHFPRLSPDGKRLLWFTGPAPKPSSWLDLLKPAIAHAGEPYDPPLTDLWVWEGSGGPKRYPLGCACSAQAIFSPDSRRIALSINEAFMMDRDPKPGRIAVVEGAAMKELARYDDRTTAPLWLGNDGLQLRPTIREKTGGMLPLSRLALDGKVDHFYASMFFIHQDPWQGLQITAWMGGSQWQAFWESGQIAAYARSMNENPNRGQSLRPGEPYIALLWEDRAILRKVTWK